MELWNLDPEEARAIVDPALQLMMDAVHRFRATSPSRPATDLRPLRRADRARGPRAARDLRGARMQESERVRRLRRERGVNLHIASD
jgi:hypothetical protein